MIRAAAKNKTKVNEAAVTKIVMHIKDIERFIAMSVVLEVE